jgi:Secretion system C-terminal sorting domain/Bacterial Ig domain/Metallo-peptidase family M12
MLLLKLKKYVAFTTLFMSATVFMQAQKNQDLIIESLPENLPPSLSTTLFYSGEKLTLELEKNYVFGKNTKFLVDDGSGKLIEIDKGLERTYIGSVAQHPDFIVSAVMTDQGLIATINRPGQEMLEIRPSSVNNKRNHTIFTSLREEQYNCNVQSKNQIENHTEVSSALVPESANEISKKIAGASLPPTRVMDVLEYEVGVEIGSRAFFATTAYNGNLASAQASAQSLAGNLNSRYLRGAGISHKLGTVIIRTNASTDPLRDKVISTGGAANANESLAAFRDYWNNNPNEVGRTHDLAIYHVLSAPSGLAYVNAVATNSKYGTVGGNGATSWAGGTAVHEIGHLWSLAHTESSGIFYESKPRNNAGSTTAGGTDVFVSVMHGGGDHNIGRLATNEALAVLSARNAKRSAGTLITNPGSVPPFGVYDNVTIPSSTSTATFDVIANDFDVNNDALDIRLLDIVSQKGGTISLSTGTGPGGRNKLTYTPPASGLTGTDFFHYTVFDPAGGTDFGAVYVNVSNTLGIDDVKLANIKVDLFPNPVNDIINLSFSENKISSNTSVIIYNSLGKTIKTVKISSPKDSIDVSTLLAGVYYLKIVENNATLKNISFVKL